ncbi:hypothetical protein [Vibrio furnissii]|uniref:hypothetical protein n=1 Tax=Vibrio furnissii TaxID=29494 RepID=UPI001EEBB84A|nr:hypothetical protein [Vibrio furnissii]MCG6216053.1 hypothetical protein [Vibrio furnissii]
MEPFELTSFITEEIVIEGGSIGDLEYVMTWVTLAGMTPTTYSNDPSVYRGSIGFRLGPGDVASVPICNLSNSKKNKIQARMSSY